MLLCFNGSIFIFNTMQLDSFFLPWWKKQFSNTAADQFHLILAVSGGLDSVVLTDIVAKSGLAFSIAHCNFQLRGEESMRDEKFVKALGVRYQQKVLLRRFDTNAIVATQKGSIQEIARELRYQWFADLRDELQVEMNKFVMVLTAHHADDNIETVLMNLFRGTGIQGLTGMEAYRWDNGITRPLLDFPKEALKAYADQHGLTYVEDSSNAAEYYTRNYFRNSLIPSIKEVFPTVEQNILHTIARLKEVEQLYNSSVNNRLSSMMELRGDEYHIPVGLWKEITPLVTITYEMLKRFGFNATQVGEALKLLNASNSGYIASHTHRLIRNRNWMILAPLVAETAPSLILIDASSNTIEFTDGVLTLEESRSTTIPTEKDHVMVAADELVYPLVLRKWKEGDYFYPLGMPKKKKISRFLIDIKCSKTDKEKVWVLESNKKIVWVIGLRIDHRFRVTESTQKKLLIRYSK